MAAVVVGNPLAMASSPAGGRRFTAVVRRFAVVFDEVADDEEVLDEVVW